MKTQKNEVLRIKVSQDWIAFSYKMKEIDEFATKLAFSKLVTNQLKSEFPEAVIEFHWNTEINATVVELGEPDFDLEAGLEEEINESIQAHIAADNFWVTKPGISDRLFMAQDSDWTYQNGEDGPELFSDTLNSTIEISLIEDVYFDVRVGEYLIDRGDDLDKLKLAAKRFNG